MALNGISTLTYKHQRQAAKLALAASDRAAGGRRANLDDSQLPTLYKSGDNDTADVIDNPNVGGLVYGRPWVDGPVANTIIMETSDALLLEDGSQIYAEV